MTTVKLASTYCPHAKNSRCNFKISKVLATWLIKSLCPQTTIQTLFLYDYELCKAAGQTIVNTKKKLVQFHS